MVCLLTRIFIYSELRELQQTYQALVLDVQGIIESHLHPPQSAPTTTVPPQQTTSTGFFSNLKVKTRGRSNTNPTTNEVAQRQQLQAQREQRSSQYKELASAFYTLNSKYRISWECAELLIELAGGGDGGASTTATWGVGSAPPLEFPLPHPNEIMGGAGAADLGVGKKRSRERAITLAGDEAKPTPSTSSIPAALSASSSSMPTAASNVNNSWRASTGRHDLSQRQLVLLREMLNNANATADVTPEDMEAEVEELVAPNANKEWRWGDAGNSTVTLPEEEAGQQRGGKRRSGRMSGIRDMLRALKKGAAVGPSSPPAVDAAEDHHHHDHDDQQQQPPVPLLSPEIFQSTTSLSTESSAGSRRRYPNLLPRIPNTRRANKSSTGPESVRSASKSRTRSPEGLYPASFSAPKSSPRRPSLASIFRNIGGSKRPVSVSVDDPVVPSSATTTTDTGTGDSSSNTGEEEDWDRMDSASDLDAAANALQVADGGGTVRGGGVSRKLSKNRKGKSPYLQDPHAPVPVVRPSIVQKRSWSASQTSLQQHQGSSTGNFGTQQLVRPLRLSNVDETEYPHSPVLPTTTTTTTSRPSSRVSGKFGSPTSHPQSSSLRAKPPHLLAASATMPILSASASPPTRGPSSSTTMPVISSPVSGVATAGAVGADWKLAMTPENIRPLLENAREVHARLCDCVEELGRLKEMVVS